MAAAAGKSDPDGTFHSSIFRAAPTGVAANLFLGRTLHSLLRLPVRGRMSELPQLIDELRKLFRGCVCLIIDEKSMVGLNLLGLIDRRLRQLVPSRTDEPWGGISTILSGDSFQQVRDHVSSAAPLMRRRAADLSLKM